MAQKSAGEVCLAAAKRLEAAGVESPRLDARVLLAHALGLDHVAPPAHVQLRDEQLALFNSFIARRAMREPLAYITGTKEFFGLDFEVGPGLLIPRPETETLVEQAMRAFPNRQAALDVLDLGTGTACLIVSFLKHYERAKGVGVDASGDAVACARRNVQRHGLSARCNIVESGWNANAAFDVVFANPPYLTEEEFAAAAPEIARFEPKAALAAGYDGLAAYRELTPGLAACLRPEGLAFLEIGAGQSEAVEGILDEGGLEVRHVAHDLAGIARCIVVGWPAPIRPIPQKTVGKEGATR